MKIRNVKSFHRKTSGNKSLHRKLVLPSLSLLGKVFLYVIMGLLTGFSVISVTWNLLPFLAEIILYVMAALALPVVCCYFVLDCKHGWKWMKTKIEANSLIGPMVHDYRYRTLAFALPGMAFNLVFAVFHGVIGIISHSLWFGTFSAYYILLSVMRFLVVSSDRRISGRIPGLKRCLDGWFVFRCCGFLFLVMTVMLGGAVVLLLNAKGGKHYPGFTIYAVAAYTFYKIIVSFIHMVKAGKLKSPALMALRSVGYTDACVSVLSLQTAMLAAFAKGEQDSIRIMNGMTGIVVCMMVFFVGIRCIRISGKMKLSKETGGMDYDSSACSGR